MNSNFGTTSDAKSISEKKENSPERALVLDDNSGFGTKGNTWVEEEAQSLIHLPKDRLGVWKGIN
jgi:hypothetical protein